MKEIESEPGTHISEMARRLIKAARVEPAFIIFNGICLPADKHSTVEGLCAEYDRLSELRRAEYAASPKGIAAKEKAESECQRLQAQADVLMGELPLLDFTNFDACLKWLCDIEDARDRIGVNVDAERIRQTFLEHGYEPNAYCGNQFIEGNREIEARWLIGQAIAATYVPMVRHFCEKLGWTGTANAVNVPIQHQANGEAN